MVIGSSYTISVAVQNNPGDDGSGTYTCTTASEALRFGTSTSLTSFGTSVGTSALISASTSYSG